MRSDEDRDRVDFWPSNLTYWCVVCGACRIEEDGEGGYVTIHSDVTHPEHLSFNEEEKPQ